MRGGVLPCFAAFVAYEQRIAVIGVDVPRLVVSLTALAVSLNIAGLTVNAAVTAAELSRVELVGAPRAGHKLLVNPHTKRSSAKRRRPPPSAG